MSAITGLGLIAACSLNDGSDCHDSNSTESAALILLPIGAPFIALTRPDVQKNGGAVFWPATFGAMQVAGAGRLTYYVATPKYHLEKSESARVILLPVFDRHFQGLWLSRYF